MKIIHDFFLCPGEKRDACHAGLWFMGGGFFHRLAEGLPPAMPVRVPMWVQAYVYMWGYVVAQ